MLTFKNAINTDITSTEEYPHPIPSVLFQALLHENVASHWLMHGALGKAGTGTAAADKKTQDVCFFFACQAITAPWCWNIGQDLRSGYDIASLPWKNPSMFNR